MKIRISGRKGVLGSTEFVFSGNDPVTLGRGFGVDIQIRDESISRKHCRIEMNGNTAILRDLDSTNGTFLNGERIRAVELNSGDVLSIGNSSFLIQLTPDDRVHKAISGLRFEAPPGQKEQQITRRIRIPDASGAIQRAASAGQYKEAVRDLNHLYNVLRQIPRANDPKLMSRTLLRGIFEFVDAERGCVLGLEDPGDFEILGTYFRDQRDKRQDLKVSRTILDECIVNNEVIISRNAMDDERFKPGHSIVGQNLKSVLCVPLEGEGQVIGAIYLDTRSKKGAFSEREVRLIVAIGQQAGADILRARLHNNLEALFISTVRCLVAAIDAKDKYTKGHSERVTFYALNLAREMGLTERQTLEVYLAGLLHDIGKIGIEEKILNKKGALTQKEFDQVRLHPIRGVGIIRNIKNIDSIINAALHHHERFDGTGYPSGLKETGIPLASRLLAVADAYDAMTSDRPYRKRMTQRHAMEEIRNHSGTQFSPEVADTFLQALIEKKIDMGDLESVLDSHQKDLYKLWH